LPPFGDAHTHGFDNSKNIEREVATNLGAGIFYVLSLTNSIRGKQSVAAFVNKPSTIDVAYADAGLTATLGHPILSAEVTANRIPWDQLGQHWQQLLKSHTAEGDVYFVIDNMDDLKRKWPAIIRRKPDVIKIFLLDTEHFEERKKSTSTIDDKGLNPALVPEVVRRAHRSGLRVAAHVETAADLRVAVAAGVDIIARLPGLDPKAGESPSRYELTEKVARVMARKGITVIPTAWLAERLAAPKPWLSGAAAMADVAQLERAKTVQRKGLKLLKSHGVRIAIGSDLFENASREAKYLEQLGTFSRSEILDMWSRTTPQLIFPRRRNRSA
jgi:imidazolonepropionase-like amidohydrolase